MSALIDAFIAERRAGGEQNRVNDRGLCAAEKTRVLYKWDDLNRKLRTLSAYLTNRLSSL